MVNSIFAPVKRMARVVSDFRVGKSSHLRRSSKELCYPRTASLENALEEKVGLSFGRHRWHLTSYLME